MKFEWDKNKNISNIRKHGIDSAIAVEAFSDVNQVSLFDDTNENEDRWNIIGLTSNLALIFVVHTFQDQYDYEITRIISARPATAYKRKFYARKNSPIRF
jgi:uncharacterized protein